MVPLFAAHKGSSGMGPLYTPWQEVIETSDIITLHAPLTEATRHMIARPEFQAMKRKPLIINTARGGLVDEAALVEALTSGRIRAAGLDVFVDEPPAPNDPLLKVDNLLLSPHIAGLTEECAIRMAEVSARNALAGLDGNVDPELVVNKHVLNHS